MQEPQLQCNYDMEADDARNMNVPVSMLALDELVIPPPPNGQLNRPEDEIPDPFSMLALDEIVVPPPPNG